MLSLAAGSLKQVINNDVQDQIDEAAANTDKKMQFFIDYLRNNPSPEITEEFDNLAINTCYQLNGNLNSPNLLSFAYKCGYTSGTSHLSRSNCSIDTNSTVPFSFVCLTHKDSDVYDFDIMSGYPPCSDNDNCKDTKTSAIYPL